jgi:hypothetical protein
VRLPGLSQVFGNGARGRGLNRSPEGNVRRPCRRASLPRSADILQPSLGPACMETSYTRVSSPQGDTALTRPSESRFLLPRLRPRRRGRQEVRDTLAVAAAAAV